MLLLQECLDEVSQIIQPDDFYVSEHRLIYEAALTLHMKNKTVDAVTVGEYLEKHKQLAEAGGADLLMEAVNAVPHAAHAKHYAEIVAGKAKLRGIINASGEAARAAYDEVGEPDEIAANAETLFHRIIERGTEIITDIKDLLADAIRRLTSGKRMGIPTGFSELDKKIFGLQPGAVIVLAARPSVGKTSLCLKIIFNAAKQGHGGLLLSLEQTKLEIAEKLLALESGISINEARSCNGDESLCEQLMYAAQTVGELNIVIDDRTDRTIEQLAASIRLQQRKRKIEFAVIDYLQFIKASDPRAPREQQVAHISRQLKSIAKTCNIPVLCLAQLNRQVELRADKTPQLSDLRESGAIEQDADVVLFIDRPCLYDTSADENYAKLILKKNRAGTIGDIPLHFRQATTDFMDVEKFSRPEEAEMANRYWDTKTEE